MEPCCPADYLIFKKYENKTILSFLSDNLVSKTTWPTFLTAQKQCFNTFAKAIISRIFQLERKKLMTILNMQVFSENLIQMLFIPFWCVQCNLKLHILVWIWLNQAVHNFSYIVLSKQDFILTNCEL